MKRHWRSRQRYPQERRCPACGGRRIYRVKQKVISSADEHYCRDCKKNVGDPDTIVRRSQPKPERQR